MFVFSSLSRLFITERHRQRAGEVGFSIPALSEVELGLEAQPLLATNMRGAFVPTNVSMHGYARYGFSECLLDQESDLLLAFYRSLLEESTKGSWSNKVSSVAEAITLMPKLGFEPKILIGPASVEPVGNLAVVRSDLPEGTAILSAHPQNTGSYTRVGDYVGVLAQRIDRAFVVVA
jgi:hypothetical protein